MNTIICDCDDCQFYKDGECTLDYVYISSKLTGGGFLTLCDSYSEKVDNDEQ